MGYPSDLSDAEWELVEEHFRRKPGAGRPPKDRRAVVNAIFYINRTGCQWRYLPNDFPKWKTVHWYFCLWRMDGTWERLNDTLRKAVRRQAGRQEEPSAAIIDSQSVKTTERGGPKEATMGTRRSRGANATSW
jgi:putative transposase